MYLSNKNKFKIYYLFYTDPSTNKIKKVTTKTKLKNEALEFLRNFNPDETKVVKEIRNYNFKDLQFEVLKYTSENYTPSTNQIYRNTTNYFLKIVGNKSLSSISINDIEFFKSERLKYVNKVTLNIDIRALKAIFNKALKWNMIKENPSQHVQFYMENEKEKLCFEDFEIEKVLSLILDLSLKNIVLFAIYTGCRINEILNIQRNDIDLDKRIITIRNKSNFKTKSGRIRQIPISDKLFLILKQIYERNNNTGARILNLNYGEEYVFTNDRNIRYSRNYVTMQFKKYLRMLGLDEKYHFHCLRHTFITNLIKKGVNINYVMEIAGHSDISTTMNYIHIVTEDLREAVNLI
jgi:integrase